MDLNASNAPTSPFKASPEHARLLRMTGRWSGQTQTWFEPGTPAQLSDIRATVDALLGGRYVRIDYQATLCGEPHAGQFIIGYDPNDTRYTVLLIDSFHTGVVPMVCTGSPTTEGGLSVLGGYTAGSERWGWRTMIRLDDSDCLHIDAFNISPDGQEHRALETRLTRATGT
jgi:hypothetical protein